MKLLTKFISLIFHSGLKRIGAAQIILFTIKIYVDLKLCHYLTHTRSILYMWQSVYSHYPETFITEHMSMSPLAH